jgi:hypothetical protein
VPRAGKPAARLGPLSAKGRKTGSQIRTPYCQVTGKPAARLGHLNAKGTKPASQIRTPECPVTGKPAAISEHLSAKRQECLQPDKAMCTTRDPRRRQNRLSLFRTLRAPAEPRKHVARLGHTEPQQRQEACSSLGDPESKLRQKGLQPD